MPIVYGFPGGELIQAERRGEVILGGCAPMEPDQGCVSCHDPWQETPSAWDNFLQRNKQCLQRASQYQWRFARDVLTQVPGLDPGWVEVEVPFTDANGGRRRLDFGIRNGRGIRVAVEVDGFDKTGRGSGMSSDEFTDFLVRQNALTAQGWTLLRFSNHLVLTNPAECVRTIQAVISPQPPPLPVTPLPPPDAVLVPRQQPTPARPAFEAPSTKKEWSDAQVLGVQWGAALVVFAIIVSIFLALSAGEPSGQHAPPGSVAPISGRCTAEHPVKGNESGKYHQPSQQYYDVTTPELCFDSAASASAAGYVASQV